MPLDRDLLVETVTDTAPDTLSIVEGISADGVEDSVALAEAKYLCGSVRE